MEALYEPNGPIPLSMKDTVESLDLGEVTKADVSMWACVAELAWHAAHGGGPNEFIALVLYAVFVIVVTVLDMFVLVIAALQQRVRIWEEANDSKRYFSALAVSHVLKKLSMMDVAIVGIALVVSCGSVYKKAGTALYFRWGLFVLFCAEACHYLAYFLVCSAAPQALEEVVAKQADQLEGDTANSEEDDSISMPETVV